MTVVRQAIGPERDVVMIVETWVPGIIPLKLGAELPWGYTKPPKTLGISVIPPQIFSVEQGPTLPGPINSGLAGNIGIPHYDSSGSSQEAIHARNVLLARLCSAAFAPTWDDLRFVLRMCGASEDFNTIFDSDTCIPQIPSNLGFLCHDTTLQMCVPSLEYRSTSWPKHVKFGGTLPRKTLDVTFDRPVWLDEVRQQGRQGSKKKKVVFTTQGTMAVDYSMCILPTIMGLSDREDIIVIAVLGVKGESLEQAPSNAIVLDYFPYDPILELADVVVTNGSYGIFSQCALHGVPMVLAGAFSEDKPEVCNRAEYSGIGLYIRSSWPRPEEIAAGVNKVLETDKYVKRAAEISAEIEEFKCLDTVERELRKLF
ncbi:udp-glucuronosyl udp-glucosyltransferase [Colletotrichum truncatum]|uniref:Udp-glucuronosyl udp-glucosyltransferase n=1 Tax=Colletotrichum truncatum TaxID=5467 RepID=A0ACC3Z7J4_COLTU|nr:udp-glucuronosyl udp-glucosyltransferase [Colletotrichum truncatum]KAF6782944.1 udp-glucuronosyl udp-glucosyltransferase [Colletotrichum truncatum]